MRLYLQVLVGFLVENALNLTKLLTRALNVEPSDEH